METRSARKVKLEAEGRPRRMVKVTEKAIPIVKAKVVQESKKTKKVKARRKKPKIAEEPKKSTKRKAVEKLPAIEANGASGSSLCAETEPIDHPQIVPFSSKKKKVRGINDLVRQSSQRRNVNNLVRRSSQRRNVNLSEKIQEKKDDPHDEINLTDSAGEVALHVEPIVVEPTRVVRGKKKPFASEDKQIVDYKTLYIDLQKKIDDSTEENYKRTIELSYLRGKVDGYEYIIGNMKNIVDFSNMRLIDGEKNLFNGTAPDLNVENEREPSPVNGKN